MPKAIPLPAMRRKRMNRTKGFMARSQQLVMNGLRSRSIIGLINRAIKKLLLADFAGPETFHFIGGGWHEERLVACAHHEDFAGGIDPEGGAVGFHFIEAASAID